MADKEKYEQGMKKYESKAKQYIDDKEKTEGLLKKALSKAKTRQSSLADVWEKLQLLLELVQAWKKGDYKEIPRKTIVTVIATILYFVSPLDLVPDFIAGLGIFDDAAVIAYAVKQISTDLEKFRQWQNKKNDK